jgi:acyl-CoA thioesterase FadM
MRVPDEFKTLLRGTFSHADANGRLGDGHAFLHFLVTHHLGEIFPVLEPDLPAPAGATWRPMVSKVEIVFRRPLKSGEEFEVRARVSAWAEQSCTAVCQMVTSGGELIATCTVELVCFDLSEGTTRPWPPEWLDKLPREATSERPHRPLGTLKGTVLYMAPDFDAPLDEFREYMLPAKKT